MSFNIYERPLFLGREGQRERTCRIPAWLFRTLPDVDVIGFQVRVNTCKTTQQARSHVPTLSLIPHSGHTAAPPAPPLLKATSLSAQEVFTDGCWGARSSLRDMLRAHGFPYSTAVVDEDNRLINGGTMIGEARS